MLIVNAEPLGAAEAEALQAKIIAGIEELEANLLRFAEGRGWKALGYKSFLEWFDARVRSVRVGPAIRAVVVHELQAPDPETGRKLTDRETAGRLGVDKDTVRKDSGRKIKSGENSPKSIMGQPQLPHPVETSTIPEQRPAADDVSSEPMLTPAVIDSQIPAVPAVIDAEVVSDSDYDAFQSEVDATLAKESLIEANGRLTKSVGEAKRGLLRVLNDPQLTVDIIRLILDDLIPEVEKTAVEAERQLDRDA